MKKNIIITGGSGLVGSNIIDKISKKKEYKKYELISIDRNPASTKNCKNLQIDILDRDKILDLEKLKPALIMHCAALANISFCQQNKEIAYKVNVEGTRNIAELAKRAGAKLIYLSTDVVFDGKKGNYKEEDEAKPLNEYGRTKFLGEKEALKMNPDTIVARINLFGKSIAPNKPGFFESIIQSLSSGKEYNAFYDVIFCPLFIDVLIDYLIGLYEKDANGIFHVAASEHLSRYDFAMLTAEVLGYDKNLVKKETIDSLYPKDCILRSKDCSLDNRKMLKTLGLKSTPTIKEMLIQFKKKEGMQKL
jgi:dTDP-4-dehydrorhamnose reductase